MQLDPKARLAARRAYQAEVSKRDMWHADGGSDDTPMDCAIRAYLRASPSQVAPANPAQVTDADQAEKFRKAMLMAERILGAIPASVSGKRLTAIDPVQVEISRAVSILWGARQDAIHAGWNPPAAIGGGGQAVAVKPLEWEGAGGTCIWASVPAWWLSYRVSLRVDRLHSLQLEWLGNRNDHLGVFATWDEAKAAAQSDFEGRVFSVTTANSMRSAETNVVRLIEEYASARALAASLYEGDGKHKNVAQVALMRDALFSALSQPHPAEERVVEALIDKVLDAAGKYMGAQYGNTALHHPTDRARIKAALAATEGR